jgi:hypothetical protein
MRIRPAQAPRWEISSRANGLLHRGSNREAGTYLSSKGVRRAPIGAATIYT